VNLRIVLDLHPTLQHLCPGGEDNRQKRQRCGPKKVPPLEESGWQVVMRLGSLTDQAATRHVAFHHHEGLSSMRQVVLQAGFLVALAAIGALVSPQTAQAVTCANGVYRAGCAGPNGAAVVKKTPPPPVKTVPRANVTCANGVYRAGCVGPNGAAVIHK
jgi:hypothetical protein